MLYTPLVILYFQMAYHRIIFKGGTGFSFRFSLLEGGGWSKGYTYIARVTLVQETKFLFTLLYFCQTQKSGVNWSMAEFV